MIAPAGGALQAMPELKIRRQLGLCLRGHQSAIGEL